MKTREFTPALGLKVLTPLYDSAIGLLTRERTWRSDLVKLIAPLPEDRILDVGCGTGSLIARIGREEPATKLIGLDPDPFVLEIARKKTEKLGVRASWEQGFLGEEVLASLGHVTKVTCSLVLHQTSLSEKAQILAHMRTVLAQGGDLYIADYAEQRTKLMRMCFRFTVQVLDGTTDTQPNADGCLPELIRAAGFSGIREHSVILTPTGSISLYKARAQ